METLNSIEMGTRLRHYKFDGCGRVKWTGKMTFLQKDVKQYEYLLSEIDFPHDHPSGRIIYISGLRKRFSCSSYQKILY